MQPVRQLMGYSAADAHSTHPLVDNTPTGGQHVRGRQVASRGAVDGKVTVTFDEASKRAFIAILPSPSTTWATARAVPPGQKARIGPSNWSMRRTVDGLVRWAPLLSRTCS